DDASAHVLDQLGPARYVVVQRGHLPIDSRGQRPHGQGLGSLVIDEVDGGVDEPFAIEPHAVSASPFHCFHSECIVFSVTYANTVRTSGRSTGSARKRGANRRDDDTFPQRHHLARGRGRTRGITPRQSGSHRCDRYRRGGPSPCVSV